MILRILRMMLIACGENYRSWAVFLKSDNKTKIPISIKIPIRHKKPPLSLLVVSIQASQGESTPQLNNWGS